MTALPLHHDTPALDPLRLISGEEAARKVGLSHERFRKVRHKWVAERDFPAEVNEPGEPVRYLARAVDAWLERRSRRIAPQPRVPTPPPSDDDRAGRNGRAALAALRGG